MYIEQNSFKDVFVSVKIMEHQDTRSLVTDGFIVNQRPINFFKIKGLFSHVVAV